MNRRKRHAPEPSISSFGFYSRQVIEEVSNQHPEDSAEDIITIIENKWNQLSIDEKSKYIELAKNDLQRFKDELKEYLPKSQGGLCKNKKRRNDPNAPKHPMSAYLFFVAENRQIIKEKHNNITFTQLSKILGEQWANLTSEEKSRYQNMTAIDKERYKYEKMKWDKPFKLTKNTLRTPKHPLAPKHPKSAYIYFISANRPVLQNMYSNKSFSELAQMLGSWWNSLSTKDKRKYEILSAEDKRRYNEDKELWRGTKTERKPKMTFNNQHQQIFRAITLDTPNIINKNESQISPINMNEKSPQPIQLTNYLTDTDKSVQQYRFQSDTSEYVSLTPLTMDNISISKSDSFETIGPLDLTVPVIDQMFE